MSDEDADRDAGAAWVIGLFVLLVLGILLWPAIMGVVNTIAFPGYESCKREIAKVLRDPGSAEYEWPPRRFSHRTNADIWRWAIEVRSTNGFGGVSAKQIGCTVDASGSSTRYSVDW